MRDPGSDFDVIVVGAGMSGLYQLHKLREMGLRVLVLESAADVGGVWYWNRYPGARFDSESHTYAYSFSKEIREEWNWTERFAPQAETLRYINFVADKLDLRRDIRFRSKVTSARVSDDGTEWTVTAEDGGVFRSRFFITAIGPLSAPTFPRIPGLESFRGELYHTSRWPHVPVEFESKRVGVIGTGSTGIQVIQEVAKVAGKLTVFQRTPQWAAPLHNAPLTPEEMSEIKAKYDAIFDRCRQTNMGFLHNVDPRSALEVSEEEREAFYEALYAAPGFGIWQGNFRDVTTDPEANATMNEFVARKIRERVKDPATAQKLIPKNHGFGSRRVPLETRYFEVYNQDNVELIDVSADPIQEVYPGGIRTGGKDIELDILVCATGFDALTGSFDRIDIRGRGGRRLRDVWQDGPRTYVGMLVHEFPNMFMIIGPHGTLGNIPRSIEYNVEWISRLVEHARVNGIDRIEATEEAAAEWFEFVKESNEGRLSMEVDSWMTGVNTNVPGKDKRVMARYSGPAPEYRRWCEDMAARGYVGIEMKTVASELAGATS